MTTIEVKKEQPPHTRGYQTTETPPNTGQSIIQGRRFHTSHQNFSISKVAFYKPSSLNASATPPFISFAAPQKYARTTAASKTAPKANIVPAGITERKSWKSSAPTLSRIIVPSADRRIPSASGRTARTKTSRLKIFHICPGAMPMDRYCASSRLLLCTNPMALAQTLAIPIRPRSPQNPPKIAFSPSMALSCSIWS